MLFAYMVHFWYCIIVDAVVGGLKCANRDAPLFFAVFSCHSKENCRHEKTDFILFAFAIVFSLCSGDTGQGHCRF